MPLPVFEVACVAVIALTLSSMSRARDLGALLHDNRSAPLVTRAVGVRA